ncbi:MAG: hypothetical protein LBQ88_15765 [Treponema sp.]|jgi:two-component system sensor histidine kinase YesM|nr:hypothetical protein [Treponema sp.]
MRFKTRLIVTYSIFVISLIMLMGFFLGAYQLKHLEEFSYQELRILAENMSHQLDEIVRPMTFITEFLLSDNKTLTAIIILGRVERNAVNNSFITQAKGNVQFAITTYCTDVNFHRVNYFSSHGDIISSNVREDTIPDGQADLSALPQLSLVDKAMGKPVLFPLCPDP